MRIAYYQKTLGHPHFARIRALNGQPGVSCIGVQLATEERTRRYAMDADLQPFVQYVTDGVYEDIPLPRRLTAAVRHLRAHLPDVVIIDSPADVVQAAIGVIATLAGARVFVRWASTWEDHPRSPLRERLKRPLYAHWDGYLATGSRACAYLRSFGVPDTKIFACGNPVDTPAFEGSGEAIERGDRFLFVGRFNRHKNLDRLVAAHRRYYASGGRWGLDLVGFGSDDEEKRLRDSAADATGIRFLGHLQRDALVDQYRTAGALVLPSLSEPWGLVVNEAMHAGLPVISSDRCGCVPELVADGVSGFTVDPEDEGSIAAQMREMEGLGRDGRAAMAARAKVGADQQRPEVWARHVRAAINDGREVAAS